MYTSADGPAETMNHTDPTAMLLPDTSAEDLWALKHIHVRQIQPLIEAIDDDGSSFVTVNEINEFTSCRPKGWRQVPRRTRYSFCLTYIQSPSLDCILGDRLRDDNQLVLATDPKELGSCFHGLSEYSSCKPRSGQPLFQLRNGEHSLWPSRGQHVGSD